MKTCKTCAYHQGSTCTCPKLYEDACPPTGEAEYQSDHLVYSYNEGGNFWTGDDFGCVHHKEVLQ